MRHTSGYFHSISNLCCSCERVDQNEMVLQGCNMQSNAIDPLSCLSNRFTAQVGPQISTNQDDGFGLSASRPVWGQRFDIRPRMTPLAPHTANASFSSRPPRFERARKSPPFYRLIYSKPPLQSPTKAASSLPPIYGLTFSITTRNRRRSRMMCSRSVRFTTACKVATRQHNNSTTTTVRSTIQANRPAWWLWKGFYEAACLR